MIDIKIFRENPGLIEENLRKRGRDIKIVEEVINLDEKFRKMQFEVQELKHKRNEVNVQISDSKKKGKTSVALIKEMGKIADEIKGTDEKIKTLLEKRDVARKEIPNILASDVPEGMDEKDNKVLRTWGKIPKFDFEPKGHADVMEGLKLIDMDRAAKVSGARFYYLRRELVLLNMALQKFAMELLMKKGFTLIQTPYMLNQVSLGGAMRLQDFEESIYKIEGEDLYMIGTSEHALAAMHQGEMLDVNEPIKYAGFSSCFRKEAGSHGKDTKGIFRVHIFEKIEQFVYCKPEDDEMIFNELIGNQEEIFRLLEIPHRIVFLCSGDTGNSMSKTYDLEGWFPNQGKYRELGSTSTAKTYQANKLNVKYTNDKNEREHVHTLNGTAMTVQRTMCCLVENYQQKDGSIKIPKALIPYMGGIPAITPVKKK